MGSKPLKYADKSAGQPELLDLFNTLKKILSDYAKGNFFVKTNQPGAFEIYYGKEVVHGGKKYPELLFVFFSGLPAPRPPGKNKTGSKENPKRKNLFSSEKS
jgi:hypothetical protein